MNTISVLTFAVAAVALAVTADAPSDTQVPYQARAFVPAHGDLARSAAAFTAVWLESSVKKLLRANAASFFFGVSCKVRRSKIVRTAAGK